MKVCLKCDREYEDFFIACPSCDLNNKKKKVSLEDLGPPLKSWDGGARLGWINYTWPFAELMAYEDKLVLGVGSRNILLEKAKIKNITTNSEHHFLTGGFQIFHYLKPKECPKTLLFFNFNSKQIIKELADLGYKTDLPII